MENEEKPNFETIKTRLDEIVEEVSEDDISLDDALDLYEEAVKLGMKVSSLLEEGIEENQLAVVDEEEQPPEVEAGSPVGVSEQASLEETGGREKITAE